MRHISQYRVLLVFLREQARDAVPVREDVRASVLDIVVEKPDQ
jgi:hypothetical protein